MANVPNAPSSSRLLCPRERYEMNKNGKVVTIGGQIHHVISSSYYISDAENEISGHLHSLLFFRDKDLGENVLAENVLSCLACSQRILEKNFYFCYSCKWGYHKVCVESPSVLESSDHPKHILQLVYYPNYSHKSYCFSCKLSSGDLFYSCFICDFVIHTLCAPNPTPSTINCPKRHKHTLHYFPRKSSSVCDVCGLKKQIDYLYVCLRCDYIVHKSCIYLPYVIKVSRHDINHRLAFTPNIPYKEWTNCGVCHEKINGNYGKYSCMKGCAYAVHTRCALRKDVSDGNELEDEPEELYENIIMFEMEGDGIIRHSSHSDHQMSLEKKNQARYDENELCQMCILPIVDHDGNVYRCMQCDFTFHESCACMPRVKQFMLHAHPLFIKPKLSRKRYDTTPPSWFNEAWFQCTKCVRYSCGFTYMCPAEGSSCGSMALDTLCASVREPFDYHSHQHQLFIRCGEDTKKDCSICKSTKQQPLSCGECDFVLCFECATLPKKVRYHHDAHLLTFSYKENVNDGEVYWCEICEEDINPKKGLYGCNECEIALHIDCIRGRDPYLKPGVSGITYQGDPIQILANNACSTRPKCKKCRRRCLYRIKIESDYIGGPYCSFFCYDVALSFFLIERYGKRIE